MSLGCWRSGVCAAGVGTDGNPSARRRLNEAERAAVGHVRILLHRDALNDGCSTIG